MRSFRLVLPPPSPQRIMRARKGEQQFSTLTRVRCYLSPSLSRLKGRRSRWDVSDLLEDGEAIAEEYQHQPTTTTSRGIDEAHPENWPVEGRDPGDFDSRVMMASSGLDPRRGTHALLSLCRRRMSKQRYNSSELHAVERRERESASSPVSRLTRSDIKKEVAGQEGERPSSDAAAGISGGAATVEGFSELFHTTSRGAESAHETESDTVMGIPGDRETPLRDGLTGACDGNNDAEDEDGETVLSLVDDEAERLVSTFKAKLEMKWFAEAGAVATEYGDAMDSTHQREDECDTAFNDEAASAELESVGEKLRNHAQGR